MLDPILEAVQENWLEKSSGDFCPIGYNKISRRDRSDNPNRGGIILYSKTGYECCICLVMHSDVSERSWHCIHSNLGRILFCHWYRQHDDVDFIRFFEEEWLKLCNDYVGTVVAGDLNAHHKFWLQSKITSASGVSLYEFCLTHGIKQIVKGITRPASESKLDLVLTDLHFVDSKVLAPIADHCIIFSKIAVELPVPNSCERYCWIYSKADWKLLGSLLSSQCWSYLENDPDPAGALTEKLVELFKRCVPYRNLVFNKSACEWLSDECCEAVISKCRAFGTPHFHIETDRCSNILHNAFQKYQNKIRSDLK